MYASSLGHDAQSCACSTGTSSALAQRYSAANHFMEGVIS
jgi:hypothetical protein